MDDDRKGGVIPMMSDALEPEPAKIEADPTWMDETIPSLPDWAVPVVVAILTAAFVAGELLVAAARR